MYAADPGMVTPLGDAFGTEAATPPVPLCVSPNIGISGADELDESDSTPTNRCPNNLGRWEPLVVALLLPADVLAPALLSARLGVPMLVLLLLAGDSSMRRTALTVLPWAALAPAPHVGPMRGAWGVSCWVLLMPKMRLASAACGAWVRGPASQVVAMTPGPDPTPAPALNCAVASLACLRVSMPNDADTLLTVSLAVGAVEVLLVLVGVRVTAGTCVAVRAAAAAATVSCEAGATGLTVAAIILGLAAGCCCWVAVPLLLSPCPPRTMVPAPTVAPKRASVASDGTWVPALPSLLPKCVPAVATVRGSLDSIVKSGC